jgi:hypothetical protein
MIGVYVFREFEHEESLRLALQNIDYILNRASQPTNGVNEEIYSDNVKIFGSSIDPDIDARMRYHGFQRITPHVIVTELTGTYSREITEQDDRLLIELIPEKVTKRAPDTKIVYMYSPERLPLYYATLKRLV